MNKYIEMAKYKINFTFRTRFLKRLQHDVLINCVKVPSVICNNCIGAMVLHDYGLPFNSPFVNLWIESEEYLYLLHHLNELLCSEITDITSEYRDMGYPVGLLGGKVRLFFQHYTSFEEAVQIWKRRVTRVDFDNIRVIYDVRHQHNVDEVFSFESVPYLHKVALLHEPDDNFPHAFYVKKSYRNGEFVRLTDYDGWFGTRYYDQFDWKSFILDGFHSNV